MHEEGVIGVEKKSSDAEDLQFDRKQKNKTVSNAEWKSSTDEDARITPMKDGTTHLAYKAKHLAELDSDLVLAAEIRRPTRRPAYIVPIRGFLADVVGRVCNYAVNCLELEREPTIDAKLQERRDVTDAALTRMAFGAEYR
jgi:hypothetical protein